MRSLVFFLLAMPGCAALLFTPTTPLQTTAPGTTIVFSGTLENTGPDDVFLNDLVVDFAPPAATYLINDPNFFFATVPGVLLAGESYVGPIFSLSIAPNTPLGPYSGMATVLGGADEFAMTVIAVSPFSVTVANTVPEPATAGLFAAALVGCVLRRRVTAR